MQENVTKDAKEAAAAATARNQLDVRLAEVSRTVAPPRRPVPATINDPDRVSCRRPTVLWGRGSFGHRVRGENLGRKLFVDHVSHSKGK